MVNNENSIGSSLQYKVITVQRDNSNQTNTKFLEKNTKMKTNKIRSPYVILFRKQLDSTTSRIVGDPELKLLRHQKLDHSKFVPQYHC